jgi:predicted RNase H-like HicB family nuclease
LKAAGLKGKEVNKMIDLKYSMVIEATEDPTFFAFFSPDLEGFTGVGNSVEDSLYNAKWGMEEHVALLKERRLLIPSPKRNPTLTIRNAKNLAVLC